MKKIIKNSNEILLFTKILSFIQNLKSILKVNSTLELNSTMDLNSTLTINSIMDLNPPTNLKGKKILKLSTTLPLNSILKLFLTIFIFNATMNLSTAANNPASFGITTIANIFLSEKFRGSVSLDPGNVSYYGTGNVIFNKDLESSTLYKRRLSFEVIVSPIDQSSADIPEPPSISMKYGQQNGYLVNGNTFWIKNIDYSYEAGHPVGWYRSGNNGVNYHTNIFLGIKLAYRSASCTIEMPWTLSKNYFGTEFYANIYHDRQIIKKINIPFSYTSN